MLGCVVRLKISTKDKGESNSKGDMNIDKNVDAIIPTAVGQGSGNDRSLYLCLGEYYPIGSKSRYVVLSVNLSNLLYASSAKLKLQLVAEMFGSNMPRYMGCGVYGSEILVGGGILIKYEHQPVLGLPINGSFRHQPVQKIYSFDTANVKSTVERLIPFGQLWEHDIDDDEGYTLDTHFQPAESCMMIRGKAEPLLVELDGKLYALGKSITYPIEASFEVFDPIEKKWSLLADPPLPCKPCYPVTLADPAYFHNTYFATAGTNILVSDGGSSYRFDTAEFNQGWRRLPLDNELCFEGTTLVVDDGMEFVLFTFKTTMTDPRIYVHLISYDFDSIKTNYSYVSLPSDFGFCNDFLGSLQLTNSSMLHLGDQKVCLLLSTRRELGEQKKTCRCIKSVVFEFNATPSFQVKFLPDTPMLEYDMDMASTAGQMLGAFLL